MGENTPYGMNESGIRLAIRLTPKAGRACIRGIARTAHFFGAIQAASAYAH